MMKKNIKKLLVASLLIFIIIVGIIYINKILSRIPNKSISMVKHVINEEYDYLAYLNGSDYIIGYELDDNSYEYSILDIHGIERYSFESDKKLNIVYANNKYFIVKDKDYKLYNKSFDLISSGDNITSLSNKLILVNDKIINIKNEVLFDNIYSINSYDNNNYFSINDNLLIDSDGIIKLEGYKVIEEDNSENNASYLIVYNGNYYTFFPSIGRILGSSFDDYYIDGELYAYSKDDKYMVYGNGFRKKVNSYNISDKIKKNYTFKPSYIIDEGHVFVTNNIENNSGIINLNTNKYKKLFNEEIKTVLRVNNGIFINNKYLYDINKEKIVYKSSDQIDELLLFDGNYKSYKKNNVYKLFDDKDNEVISSSKQIVLKNKKLLYGSINKSVSLFDNKLFDGNLITVDNKLFISYKDNNNEKLYSINKNKNILDNSELHIYGDTITSLDNNMLVIYDLKHDKKYVYEIDDEYNINVYKEIIILNNEKNIIVLNEKASVLSKIKNKEIVNINYDDDINKIIMIVSKNSDDKKLIGSYVLE